MPVDYRTSAQVELLGTLKRIYGGEYDRLPPLQVSAPAGGFYINNGMFESVDSEIAYAMVRRIKPKRVVEVGAGWSTLLLIQAMERNRQDGSPGTITAVDPRPPNWVAGQGAEVLKVKLETTDILNTLQPGDILFTDTDHIWAVGNEVDTIFTWLKGAPAGIWVHFHDVFLPGGYPEEWASRQYDEQGHLERFLDENADWQVVLAPAFLHESQPDLLEATFKTYDRERKIPPGSFWIKREAAAPAEPKKK